MLEALLKRTNRSPLPLLALSLSLSLPDFLPLPRGLCLSLFPSVLPFLLVPSLSFFVPSPPLTSRFILYSRFLFPRSFASHCN